MLELFSTNFPRCLPLELLSWREALRSTWFRGLDVVFLQLDSSLVVEVKKNFACTTDLEIVAHCVTDLSPFRHRLSCSYLLLFQVDSPPEISDQHVPESTRIFVQSGTSKSRIIRPTNELDDFISSIFLAESISLIHTIVSVGKTWSTLHFGSASSNSRMSLRLGNCSISILSASGDTTVLLITLRRVSNGS